MSYEVQSISPTGRFEVRICAWEARNALWVQNPVVVDATTGEARLRFESNLWSLDKSAWQSHSTVLLRLRKYPGNHPPTSLDVIVDLDAGTSSIQSRSVVDFTKLERCMDDALSWT